MIDSMKRRLATILMVFTALACRPMEEPGSSSKDAQAPASRFNLGQAAIDSTLLEVKMYKVIGRQSAELVDLPSSFPVVLVNQKKKDANGAESFVTIGFAINCKGRDPEAVLNAFGEVFFDPSDAEVISEEDLNALFRVTEQPILRCDALVGQNTVQPLFRHVFRVLDRDAQKVHHLVRFNTASPMDKRLYELGCSNILDAFWKETLEQKTIPILKESLGDIPGSDDIGAIHCFSSASALPQDLTLPSHKEPQPSFDVRLYRIQDEELGLLRVLLTGGKAFRLTCSATDGEMQNAFGLPMTGSLETIKAEDPAFDDFIQGRVDEQPTLFCPSVSRPVFASQAYRIINQSQEDAQVAIRNPLMRLTSFEDTLVQFNCESAAHFFAQKLLDEVATDPKKVQPITMESRDYLVRKYVPGQWQARVYTIGCGSQAEIIQLPFHASCLDYFESGDHSSETRAVQAYLKAYQTGGVDENLTAAEQCQRLSTQLMKRKSLALAGAGLQTLKPFSRLRNLQALIVPGNQLDSQSLQDLGPMPALQELNLTRNNIRAIPPSLAFGSQLRSLDLSQNSVNSLNHIGQFTQLSVLNLAENPLNSVAGIEALHSTLSYLNLSQTHVFKTNGQESLKRLAVLRQLVFLDVSNTDMNISSDVLAGNSYWGQKFPELIYLNVSGNPIKGDVSPLRLINGSSDTMNKYAALVGFGTELRNLQAYQAPETRLSIQLFDHADPAVGQLATAMTNPVEFYNILYGENLKDPFEGLELSRQEELRMPSLFFDRIAVSCAVDLSMAPFDAKTLCQ